jgi:alpha-mannosidase
LKYPAEELLSAEQDLANAEFHDILPGSSIQPVEETSLRLIDHGLEKLSRLKARAFFALSRDQKKAGDGEIPILVYNPHPYQVKAAVECEFNLPDQNWSGSFMDVKVFNEGTLLPCQVEKEFSNLHYLDWRKKVVFQADLKPSQINRFDCKLVELPMKPAIFSNLGEEYYSFDNNSMSVTISRKTGLIESYCVNGYEYIKKPSVLPIVISDNEDSWIMNAQKFGKRIGEFTLLSEKDAAFYCGSKLDGLAPVRIVEDGDARTIVEAVFGYKHSFLCIQYKILKQSSEIEVSVRVNWSEKDKLLKLTFNPTGDEHDFFGQVAYGVEHFPTDGSEVLSQKWSAVENKKSGHTLTVIDDSIYGLNFKEGELGLTLLRSPAYSGHPFPGHENEMTDQTRFIPRIDQGERLYTFWLNAGKADDRLKSIDREALAKNEKPMPVSFFPAGLDVDEIKPVLELSDDVVQVTAIKQSTQKEDALIIRLFEPTGKVRKTKLELASIGVELKVELKPFEVKTFEIDKKTKAIKEVNLIER